jgi:hypothetical protein
LLLQVLQLHCACHLCLYVLQVLQLHCACNLLLYVLQVLQLHCVCKMWLYVLAGRHAACCHTGKLLGSAPQHRQCHSGERCHKQALRQGQELQLAWCC